MRLSVSVSRVSAKCCRADLDGKHLSLSLHSALLSGREEKRTHYVCTNRVKEIWLAPRLVPHSRGTKLARNCICTAAAAAAAAAGVSSSKGENLFTAPSNATASSIRFALRSALLTSFVLRCSQHAVRYAVRHAAISFAALDLWARKQNLGKRTRTGEREARE